VKAASPSRAAWKPVACVSLGLSLATWALVAACGSAAAVGAGGSCFTALDCAAGLVCITPKGATDGKCSSNITSIETMVDAGMDVAPPYDAGPVPSLDGTQPIEAAPAVDTGTPAPATGDSAAPS
jgi:hypothetical protein